MKFLFVSEINSWGIFFNTDWTTWERNWLLFFLTLPLEAYGSLLTRKKLKKFHIQVKFFKNNACNSIKSNILQHLMSSRALFETRFIKFIILYNRTSISLFASPTVVFSYQHCNLLTLQSNWIKEKFMSFGKCNVAIVI